MNNEDIINDLLDTNEINSSNRLEKLIRLLIVMQAYGLNKGDLSEEFKIQVFNRLYIPGKILEINKILESNIIKDLNDAIAIMLPKLPEFADTQIDKIKDFLEIDEEENNPEEIKVPENPDLITVIPEDAYPDMVIDVEYLKRLGLAE